MFSNLTLGQYFPVRSPIHSLDPRTKLIALILLVAGNTAHEDCYILLMYTAAALVMIVLSHVPLADYTRQMRPFLLIIAATALLHMLLTAGEALVTIPVVSLAVTREGLAAGTLFGVRLLLMIVFSLVFMFTTSPSDMTDGLEKMVRPLQKVGIPAERFALMLGITFRFIPILFEEAQRIQRAQVARGVDLSGNLIARIRNVSSIVIPLFISVFHRADALSLSLEARGYGIGERRTHFRKLSMKSADYAVLGTVTIITILVVPR